MPKTVFGGAHAKLVEVIVAKRKAADLTQTDLAQKIGKDQTFISLIERGQRRVDIIEFVALARALKLEPQRLFAEVLEKLPSKIEI
jgi:transcriptional regulator with XRE-family HTH domain